MCVSTRSRPKAAVIQSNIRLLCRRFNTQPPEGGCPHICKGKDGKWVSTRSRPKAAVGYFGGFKMIAYVSTRSRPKAAAKPHYSNTDEPAFQHAAARRRLAGNSCTFPAFSCFNTQPPEGGWSDSAGFGQHTRFQHAAARRRLYWKNTTKKEIACFNTQPPEGGWFDLIAGVFAVEVSTRSRPKAAAMFRASPPPARLFQHAAARRRLL